MTSAISNLKYLISPISIALEHRGSPAGRRPNARTLSGTLAQALTSNGMARLHRMLRAPRSLLLYALLPTGPVAAGFWTWIGKCSQLSDRPGRAPRLGGSEPVLPIAKVCRTVRSRGRSRPSYARARIANCALRHERQSMERKNSAVSDNTIASSAKLVAAPSLILRPKKARL